MQFYVIYLNVTEQAEKYFKEIIQNHILTIRNRIRKYIDRFH